MIKRIGFFFRLGGPAAVAIALAAKFMLTGADAFNVTVFAGVVVYAVGVAIKRYAK